MDINQIITVTVIALLSLIAGFRVQQSGRARIAWITELVLRILWILVLSEIALLWCAQVQIPEGHLQLCADLTAAYLPFWLGRRIAALFSQS